LPQASSFAFCAAKHLSRGDFEAVGFVDWAELRFSTLGLATCCVSPGVASTPKSEMIKLKQMAFVGILDVISKIHIRSKAENFAPCYAEGERCQGKN
jgi:hypothetical protein